MAASADRNPLIDTILRDLRRQLEAEWPADTATLGEIEAAVTRIGDKLRRDLQQQLFEQRSCGPRENRHPCPHCGQAARYKRIAPREITTAHGLVVWSRPWYHCNPCQQGFAPRDAGLGLDGGGTSPQLRTWIARVAARVPFAPTQELIAELTGVQVGESTVERVAVAAGTALREAQRETAQREYHRSAPPPEHRPNRVYVSMDGIFAPLRDPWKRDGSLGSLKLFPKECKTAVIYEAQPGPKGDEGVTQRAYLSTLGNVDEFRPLVRQLAKECGVEYAREVVVLADGAAWIWTLAASQFPRAVEIVDYYHASQHLWEVAHARWPSDPAAAQAWVKERQSELFQDDVAAVLRAIAAWTPRTQDDCDLQARNYGYFDRNQERMQYGTFRRKGYQIGSGVMEAGCKHVVGQRLDQAGMHWSEPAAEAILALRGATLSTRSIDLQPYLTLPA